MARDLKVTQATVSAVELGQDPSLPFLASMAEVYRLDESDLRELSGQKPLQPTPANGGSVRRSELLAEFDELSDDDQERLLLVARAFKRAKTQTSETRQPALKPKKA